MSHLDLTNIQHQLRNNELAPAQLIDDLDQAISNRNPEIQAYLSRNTERAREEASKADLSLPLGGLPIAIQDNIHLAGEPFTWGSNYFKDVYTAPYDATVITRLRAAGAIPYGKLNLAEFGIANSSGSSSIATTKNPAAAQYHPGGAASGAAAAVSAGLAHAAIASDLDGSARIPASHCGVVALKPSSGLISTYGVAGSAASLEQVALVTRSVNDLVPLLETLVGVDKMDSKTHSSTPFVANLNPSLKGRRLGVVADHLGDKTDPQISEHIRKQIEKIKEAGAEIIEISLPNASYAGSTHELLATAESSSDLSCLDGIRYGNRRGEENDLLSIYLDSRGDGFGEEIKRRIILGTYLLSADGYRKYYQHAQKIRTLIVRDLAAAFAQVEAIISPTTPCLPAKITAQTGDYGEVLHSHSIALLANLSGTCALSIPGGNIRETDPPIGLHILGASFQENTVLGIGLAIEELLSKQ